MTTEKAVAIVSGGMDSAALTYWLQDQGYTISQLLSFNYGQRHRKELQFAEALATTLGVPWKLIDLTSLTELLSGSSLTDTVDVPEGHYAAENMKQTVVPNRNAMMLSVAYAVAVANHSDFVAFGAHAGDHAIYPDCRPAFVNRLSGALETGNEWASPIPRIISPFVFMSKADIVKLGVDLGVPFSATWSCYKGGAVHCGVCGTCVERREAFRLAEHEDPTVYEVPWEDTAVLLTTAP